MNKILSFVFSIFVINVWAQETDLSLKDSTDLKKCQYESQYDYENFLSAYPPNKKNNWAIGIGIGSPIILGDVRSLLSQSYAADIKIRKAFSHVFSMRFQTIFAETKGVNYRFHPINDVISAPLNHRTRITDNTLQAVFTLNNINFHKSQAKLGFNAFVGGGFTTSYSRFNLLDANGNFYDYTTLSNVETFFDRRFVVNEVLNLLDDGFETENQIQDNEAHIKNTRILPSIVLGAGLDVYLSKRVDLALETRLSKHFSDNLDGLSYGTGDDWFVYSSVGVNFKIGKNQEPLYWQNPLQNTYQAILNLKQAQDPSTSFQDYDQDGILDYLDKDPSTPMGVEVDANGIALDSDKDGIPNYIDKEKFTPNGAKVDKFGVALDTDADGVPDFKDQESNSAANAQVDAKGRTIKGGSTENPALLFKSVEVWTVFFDTDDYEVRDDYENVLLNLASYLIEVPDAKLIVTGYADSRSSAEYNLELSKKRANSVVAFFTKVGIPANRFEIQFKGKEDLLVTETSDIEQQLNRRVTLKLK
jgi:OOP family OmpA-OmpF porin